MHGEQRHMPHHSCSHAAPQVRSLLQCVPVVSGGCTGLVHCVLGMTGGCSGYSAVRAGCAGRARRLLPESCLSQLVISIA